MSVLRKRMISILLAFSMIGTASAFTVYADELEDTGNNDYVVDDGNTGEYIPPAEEIPPVEVPDDNTGDYGDGTNTEIPDDSYDDTGSDTGNSSSDDNSDYSADDSYDDSYTDDDYYYEPDYSYDYNYDYNYDYSYDYGMTFEEFERATDYGSAIVNPESPTVDMYNSNGSDKGTLNAEDWNEIKLNLGETAVDDAGDFSFIKDNDSDKNSNFSILFLIFGVLFLLLSVSIIIYLIATAVRSKNLKKASAGRRVTRIDPYETKRTRFNYDTAEIDITNYNDNF